MTNEKNNKRITIGSYIFAGLLCIPAILSMFGCSRGPADYEEFGTMTETGETTEGEMTDPILSASQLLCFEGSSCKAEVASGKWTYAIPTCELDFFESEGLKPIESLEKCGLGVDFSGDWDENISCWALIKDDGSHSYELCLTEVVEGFWSFITPGCDYEPLPEPLWGSWDPKCSEKDNPLADGDVFDYVGCQDDYCYGMLPNKWAVQLQPSCLMEDTVLEDPASICG